MKGKKEKEICGGIYFNIYKQSKRFISNPKWQKNVKIYEDNWKKHKLLLDKMSIELDQMRWFKILKEFLELSNVIDVNSRVDEINEYIIQLREKLEESQKVGNLPYEDKNGNKFNPLNTDCMGNMNNLLTKYNLFENLGLRSMNWQCRGVKKLDELTKLMEKNNQLLINKKKKKMTQ